MPPPREPPPGPPPLGAFKARPEVGPDEELVCWDGTDQSWLRVVDLHYNLTTNAVRRLDATLDVQTRDGWTIVRARGWLVRRDDGTIEVYPP